MNFTKLIVELDKVQAKNHQIDRKFMTNSTYNLKYNNQSSFKIPLHNHLTPKLHSTNTKKLKHRYHRDIKQDQIQDQNIFGFSFYQYLFKQKNNTQYINPNKNILTSKNYTKNKLNDQKGNDIPGSLKQKHQRPKSVLIQRGIPTRRKIHHKISLHQTQKLSITQNIQTYPQFKQQYFTQKFFNFKSQEKQNLKKSKFCRQGIKKSMSQKNTQLLKGSSFINQKKSQDLSNYKQCHKISESKNLLILNENFRDFYQKNKPVRKLNKKRRYRLDFDKVEEEKAKFNKNIQSFINNFVKKDISNEQNQRFSKKCIIYDKKQSAGQKCIENQAFLQKKLNQYFAWQPINCEIDIIKNSRNFDNNQNQYQQQQWNLSDSKRTNLQSQLTQDIKSNTSQIFQNIKPSFQLPLIHSTNELFLQSQQLRQLNFKQDKQLDLKQIESKLIQKVIELSSGQKQFKLKTLRDFSSRSYSRAKPNLSQKYDLYLFIGSTLDCLMLRKVKVTPDGFFYNKKKFSLFLLFEQILRLKDDFEFVHVMVTRQNFVQKDQNQSQNQMYLVFQTFVHNYDIKYFQSRQMEVQYLKYFLKRFLTYDTSLRSRNLIQERLSLLIESEISIPEEFEEFCSELDLKEDTNIFTLHKNLWSKGELLFKCLSINLSTLLLNAHKSIQMVKKQIFEGYNWKGVSLKKQPEKNKFKQLQHFYI